MSEYKVIIFDLDGTLTDSKEGIVNSIRYALGEVHISAEVSSEDASFIGPPIRNVFKESFAVPDEKLEQAVGHYREYFGERGMLENTPYSGIEELLKQLKAQNKVLFVATSKPTGFSTQILQHFHLDHYFQHICGSSMDNSMTTKTEIIQFALSTFDQIPREKIIMIGDKMHDIIGAQNNNIDSIGVLYGYGSREEIEKAKPTFIAKDVEELTKLLVG